MARPQKQGLEYYPQDTDIHSDRKIRRLRKEYCANGYIVYDYIKSLIYKENGYWIKLDEDLIFDVADFLDCGITKDFVNQVIQFCFQINLFHQGKHKELGILTSSGIQKRFLKAKRNGVIAAEMIVIAAETPVIAAETNIITPELPKHEKTGKKTGKKTKKNKDVIAAETPVIAAESTQSKVKESKVNNNSNTIITKINGEEDDFTLKCKLYKNNWELETIPEVCEYFFLNDKTFDKTRADCLRVLSMYYICKPNETFLDVMKLWLLEFNTYLNRTNIKKTMQGPQGYPFHFFNRLNQLGGKLKNLPQKNTKKEEGGGLKSAAALLAERK